LTQRQIDIPKEEIAQFCERWSIIELSLFGSVLSEEFGPGSDVDVLVAFAPNSPWSLFDIITMQEELQTIFGREVDLVEKQGLVNPFRRHSILKNRQVIYAA
jgi:hypothetical protein